MLLVLVLVFIGVFAIFALVLAPSGVGASQKTKKAIAVLESALATESSSTRDLVVDLRKNELLSAVPWINRWLLKIELAPRLRTMLHQADVKWTTSVLLMICGACFAIPAYLIYLRTDALLIALLGGLVLAFAPIGYVLNRRSARFSKFEQELPEALELMVSALRAGHSFAAALGLVGRESPDPLGAEFRICFEEQNYGLELRTAMDNLVTRVPLQDLRIVVTAILIQKECGGNLAEVLEKTSYVIRERFRLKRQVRTHTAQGRMTGYILSLLPVFLGFALYLVNPKTMSLLWTNPLGLKLLYTAIGMTALGGLIIRKIVNLKV